MRFTDILPDIPPVKRLLACAPEVAEDEVDFWVWMRSLQGLVNRREPHLYLIQGESPGHYHKRRMYEDHWLEYYGFAFGLPVEHLGDVDAILDRFKDAAEGYVLYDPDDVIQTQNLAITRCGLESLLPVAPAQEAWMTRHGIPRRDDLRGKFKDDADAAEWAIDNLWPRCCRRLYANFCVHRPY